MTIKASASVRLNAVNSGAVYAQMMAGAQKSISVRSITLVARTNVATEIGLARSVSVGTASAGSVATGVAHRAPNQAGVQGTVEYGWSVQPSGVPTGPAPYLRRELWSAPSGSRFELWQLEDDPIAIEPTGAGTGMMGLCLVNVGSAAGAALDVHVTWEYGHVGDR